MKLNSITSTVAIAAIYIATLSSSNGTNLDLQLLEQDITPIYEQYIHNANVSIPAVIPNNSSMVSYDKQLIKKNALIEDISNEIFGEMRYLTPEENEKKIDMYRKMSTVVEGASFFD
ncbi:MAG: hypothetical protein MJ089_06715 [Ruminococcus sp.]|nr:hypothetical protein [Ruminococcus sp.]